MKHCAHCGAEVPSYVNYCGWDCIVGAAKAAGGEAHQPNGLPIRSVKFDNSMWEHEHGDHPDYRFPVTVKYIGHRQPIDRDDCSYCDQDHALIYTDGCIALTLYECTYGIFSVETGESLAGHMWKRGDWQLTEGSLEEVRKLRS